MKPLLLLSVLILVGCKPAPESGETTLLVEGMTCNSCVQGITAELERTPGVTDATVNLTNKQAVVTHDKKTVTAEQLEQRVDALGFDASLKPES